MNVYDFDKTIYDGDSTLDFYFFCLKKYKKILIYMPVQLFGFIMFKLGIYTKEKFKSSFLCFVKVIDVENEIELFWNEKEQRIKRWYIKQKNYSDVIISASPDFILEPICRRLNVKLICTKADSKTGKLLSLNCYGNEKVIRFKEQYNENINNFYSDSLSDSPMSNIAEKSFVIDGEKIVCWNDYKENKLCKKYF